jgi:hypothetical protein
MLPGLYPFQNAAFCSQELEQLSRRIIRGDAI